MSLPSKSSANAVTPIGVPTSVVSLIKFSDASASTTGLISEFEEVPPPSGVVDAFGLNPSAKKELPEPVGLDTGFNGVASSESLVNVLGELPEFSARGCTTLTLSLETESRSGSKNAGILTSSNSGVLLACSDSMVFASTSSSG